MRGKDEAVLLADVRSCIATGECTGTGSGVGRTEDKGTQKGLPVKKKRGMGVG